MRPHKAAPVGGNRTEALRGGMACAGPARMELVALRIFTVSPFRLLRLLFVSVLDWWSTCSNGHDPLLVVVAQWEGIAPCRSVS